MLTDTTFGTASTQVEGTTEPKPPAPSMTANLAWHPMTGGVMPSPGPRGSISSRDVGAGASFWTTGPAV